MPSETAIHIASNLVKQCVSLPLAVLDALADNKIQGIEAAILAQRGAMLGVTIMSMIKELTPGERADVKDALRQGEWLV